MKFLKLFLLGTVAALAMTFAFAVMTGGPDKESQDPGKGEAEVQHVRMIESRGCIIVFSLDGHAVDIQEPSTEKCRMYQPGDRVQF